MLPPIVTRQAGRPKHNIIKGYDEKDKDNSKKRNQKKCNKCGGYGHNVRTCRYGPIASKRRRGAGAVRGGLVRGGTTTQMPMQMSVLTIPLPPQPYPIVANSKAPSKKRKFFQPLSMSYFP